VPQLQQHFLCHRHSGRTAYRPWAKPASTDFDLQPNSHTQPWFAVYWSPPPTHLPTSEWRKAELAWLVDSYWTTKWSHVNHRSGINQGKSANPNFTLIHTPWGPSRVLLCQMRRDVTCRACSNMTDGAMVIACTYLRAMGVVLARIPKTHSVGTNKGSPRHTSTRSTCLSTRSIRQDVQHNKSSREEGKMH